MQHIDVSTVLRNTVDCSLYSNLVTRPTGAAVRRQIERMVRDVGDRSLTVIDLTHVSMLDFSCADEVVAKLLLPYAEGTAEDETYFVFRGVTDDHWEAIEAVLHRHDLALVRERDGEPQLAGVVDDDERRVWNALRRLGPADAASLAAALDDPLATLQRTLEALWRRRLVMKAGARYVAVGG
jgi:hypothetical protein